MDEILTIQWWMVAVIIPAAIAAWKLFEAKIWPSIQQSREDKRDHIQKLESAAHKVELTERLQSLDSQAVTHQMLTQIISDVQSGAQMANEFIQKEVSGRMDMYYVELDLINRRLSEIDRKILELKAQINRAHKE
jgi:uncharacterized coiled-coil DUF342 family protein